MQFVNDFSPFLFRISLNGGEFGIRWYGLAYMLGFVLAWVAFKRAINTGRLPNLSEDALTSLLVAIILGVIVGGRLGFVVQHPDELLRNPLFVVQLWKGGMAFFGGLVGVILGLVWFANKYKDLGISFWSIGDIATIPAATSLGLGRIANFINQELYGVPTGADWGVIYKRVDMIPRHPSELYEMTTHFVLAGLCAWSLRKWGVRPGVTACVFVIGYGLMRVITEHFRTADTWVGPLTNGQAASLVIAAVGMGMLATRRRPASELSPN